MARKKIILYTDYYNDRVGISAAYVDFFSMFGEVLLVNSMNDLDFFITYGDILALPGGADVDPMRYGGIPTRSGRPNAQYEYLDKYLLQAWLKTEKPVVGICRGMQTLNVALGGTLFQHVNLHVGDVNDRSKLTDTICTIYNEYKILKVNSFHHQAVKKVADGFDVVGWGTVFQNCPSLREGKYLESRPIFEPVFKDSKNKKSGIIAYTKIGDYFSIPEIIKHRTLPYIAFQYHPEEFYCPLAIDLIEEVTGTKADYTQLPTLNLSDVYAH